MRRRERRSEQNLCFFSRCIVLKCGSVAQNEVIRGWACSSGAPRRVTLAAAAAARLLLLLLLRSSVEGIVLYAAHNGIKRRAAYNFLRWW